MKRIILSVMASIAMIIGLAAGFAPVANAAPTVPVGPGTGWSTIPGVQLSPNACTITALGHDNAGRLVALSAGHCWKSATGTYPGSAGLPIYKSTTGQQIGTLTSVHTWGGQPTVPQNTLDYQVIELDPNVVIPRSLSEDGTVSVTSFGTANLFQNLCKNGIGTGTTCGVVTQNSNPNYYKAFAAMNMGDSGSPAVKAGTGVLVGMGVGGDVNNAFTVGIFNKIQPILADINAQGSYGAGFTLVP